MEIINRKQRMSSLARKLRRENKLIGFVPTMGSLHEGHMSLVRNARQMCDVVIASVFVNPTQFNQETDFDLYPRNLTADAERLSDASVDYLFAPELSDIYPDGFATHVMVDEISDKLEGASRPGHFRGVATIVTILFNTIRPDYAYFGQKDAQQVAVIQRLTKDLAFETEIVVLPIIREASGLAMSSRNERLTPELRENAAVMYKSLRLAEEAITNGEKNAVNLLQIVQNEIETESEAKIDYIAIVDQETLDPVEKIGERPVLIALAVFFGEIRLIDNLEISI